MVHAKEFPNINELVDFMNKNDLSLSQCKIKNLRNTVWILIYETKEAHK